MANETLSSESPLLPEEGESISSKHLKELRGAIATCKQYRRKLVQNWSLNIDFRRGKPFASQSDQDRIAVNLDWSLTKQKQALLFSQVPAVRVNHPPQTTSKEAAPWLYRYESRINDTAIQAGVEAAMDEILPDNINAAGIGIGMVAREIMTEDVEVPVTDISMFPPEIQDQIKQLRALPDGTPLEMTVVPSVIDSRYMISRISPADFLWPIDFTGSDFENSPWLGRSGRMPWAEAVVRFKLNEADKQKYLGDERNSLDQLNNDQEKAYAKPLLVGFDEVYYKEYKYNTKSKGYNAIRHIVWVGENDTPIINEAWKGQKYDEQNKYFLGSQLYPIQVLTTTYISDESIPPSDSAIGRPQVNELNKSRTQMNLQREHSQPVRWFDVNRVDPMIQNALMRGTWQNMIPVQGQGTNIIGEVSRSALPQENYQIDAIIKNDLAEEWQVWAGQTGTDIETRAEVLAAQGNMQTRIGKDRARVGKFYVRLMEILGGLLSIYEDPMSFGEGFNPAVSRTLYYSILADSTVLLDSTQRIKRLIDFVNFTAKSGLVNLEPVLKEIATLSGLDASVVIQPPKPNPPVEPNISLRLTGTEDMMNPLTLAFLMKSGQAPAPELIEQAKQLIQVAVTPAIPPPIGDGGPPPAAPPPGGGLIPPPMIPPPSGPMPPLQVPEPPPPAPGDANPQYSAMNRVNRRVIERGQD